MERPVKAARSAVGSGSGVHRAEDGCGIFLDRQTPACETGVVPRASAFEREFKGVRGFKDGWYYRLTDGYPQVS